jgi:F-type H+-transporting ATPase subunit delta
MEGPSRESFAASRERLEAVSGDDPARIADDLRGVARLLVREPGLRRALVDPSKSSDARVELLTGLFGERVSAQAMDVLTTLVKGRWRSATDLVDATERLAIEAELTVAERDGSLADVEDALFRFGRVVAGNPRLAVVLSDPTVDIERRAGLVRDLLEGKASEVTIRLVEFAVAGFGGRSFDAALERLVELTAARRDREVAYVRVAAPLTEQQEERLISRLSGIYGRQISLQVVVDEAVIGGATVKVGDDLYDGSVARRLDQARSALAK